MNKPNIIIFRLPDGDFVHLNICGKQIDPSSRKVFNVLEGDSYKEKQLDQIVFADFDGTSSLELCSFSIRNDELGQPAKIHEMSDDDLNLILPSLLSEVDAVLEERRL